MMKILKKIIPTFTILFLAAACSGGGGAKTPKIDKDGVLKSLAELEAMRVDQLVYYTKDDLHDPDLEVWIVDSQTKKGILCADAASGMQKVKTEAIVYGNLDASFRRLLETLGYQGKLFQVVLYQNGAERCSKDHIDVALKTDDSQVGKSAVVNFDTLISKPIVATNGSFYIRLRSESAPAFSMPVPITNAVSADTLSVGGVTLSNTVTYGDDSDNSLETEVHIVDAATNEMIACSGDSEGMNTVKDPGTSYGKLFADLIDAQGKIIDFAEAAGRQVKVILSENDGTACPQAISTGSNNLFDNAPDDILGESDPVVWDDLPGRAVNMTNGAGMVTFDLLGEF